MESSTTSTVWADCQGLLAEACGAMAPGELLHGDNFSLFEAMSAIEIMDPKMDAGMSTKGFKSAQEAIDGGSAPLDLTVPQLLDVMDQLLAYEATWQSGHSLAQTVYSCLYLHAPERTAANELLNAYCKVARSTCNLIRTMVCVADVHEENEDFIGSTFGFPLELEEDGRCMTLIAAVEGTLAKQLKAAKGDSRRKSRQALPPLQADPSLEEPYCSALLARFRFRRALHQALTLLDKGPKHEKSTQGARQALAAAAKELAFIRISTPQLAHGPRIGGPSGVSESGGAVDVNTNGVNADGVNTNGVRPAGENADGVNAEGVKTAGVNLDGVNVDGQRLSRVIAGGVLPDGLSTAGANTAGGSAVDLNATQTADRLDTGDLNGVNRIAATESGDSLGAARSGAPSTGAVTPERSFGRPKATGKAGQEADSAFFGGASESVSTILEPVSTSSKSERSPQESTFRSPQERAQKLDTGASNGALSVEGSEGSVSKSGRSQNGGADVGGATGAAGRPRTNEPSQCENPVVESAAERDDEKDTITASMRATSLTGYAPASESSYKQSSKGAVGTSNKPPLEREEEPGIAPRGSLSTPGDTPHNSERMPCTIFLPEGGSTSAPGPTVSEAVGITAGQPPIHTIDMRQGVTGTAEASTASGWLAVGFDESVNRRLLASTPPRSMKILTWIETLDYYDHLLQDLAQITHAPAGRPLSDVIQFVADFSNRQPCVIARSRLFLHLFPEAYLVLGRIPLTELVLDAVHLPPGGMRKDPGVLAFAVKAARAVKQFLRLLCTNSSRQRRKLARCLAEWEEVRKEAEAQSLHNGAVRAWATQLLEAQKPLGAARPADPWLDHVFTCWTEQQICRIMGRHLALGFPQELYSLSELPVVFWYLARVYVNHAGLLHTEGNHLSAMHGAHLQGGSRRKSKAGESTGRYIPSVDQYLVTAYGRLTWGMTQAFALMQRSNKLPQPASPFNGGFEVYLQRFSPFIAVHSPAASPYDEYTGELEYMLSAEYDVVGGSLRAFEDALEMARVLFAELPNMSLPRVIEARRAEECRALEQVVQRNIVALKVLAHVGAAATHAVTCDFSYHQFFPVLTVKKVVKKNEGG